MPKIGCGPLPMNVVVSRIPEVPFGHASPNRCAGNFSRIADLEGRLSSLIHQTRTAMEQAERSSSSLKKVSFLAEQMSILVAKISQLEECDIYMTEIIKSGCEQLQCKLPGAPECLFVVTLGSIYLDFLLPRYLIGPYCQRSSSKRANRGS
jgi:hypothetical protein